MQRQAFDRRFLDPGMCLQAFAKIRQTDLMQGDPLLQRQTIEDILLGHLMPPRDRHVSDFKTSLNDRTKLARGEGSYPEHCACTGQPACRAQRPAAAHDQLRSARPLFLIRRLHRARPLPLVATMGDPLSRTFSEWHFHAACSVPFIFATADSSIRSVNSS